MNIVNFSGGKDSTAMLLKMIEEKIPIHRIYFVDTGLELPETYEFIKKVSEFTEKSIGIPIDTIKDHRDWDYYFYKKITKGKSKGEIRGFPYVISPCWYQRDRKVRLVNSRTDKSDIVFIGFAKDEEKRKMKEETTKTKVKYPLIEFNMTEEDCMNYCRSRNMLNPLYDKYGFKRIGCWLCPKQPIKDLIIIKKNYPELWNKLLKYEKDSPHGFKPRFKLEEIKEQ